MIRGGVQSSLHPVSRQAWLRLRGRSIVSRSRGGQHGTDIDSLRIPPCSTWGAGLQAEIPPIVDAPVFALRKPASFVFSPRGPSLALDFFPRAVRRAKGRRPRVTNAAPVP